MAGAGELNRLVTFERRDKTQTDSGASKYVYTIFHPDLVRYPCKYRPERGWERQEQDKLESAVMGVIRLRACDAVRGVREDDIAILHSDDSGDRDQRFVIKYSDNRDRHDRFLQFTVESGTSER